MQTRIPPYSNCDTCGAPIHYGQPAVSLSRNLERCDGVGDSGPDQITVTESLHVLTLCPACGESLPAAAVTQLLRAELKRRLAIRN